MGDLLFITLGGQVVAIDSRTGGTRNSETVWQSGPGGRLPANLRRSNRRGGAALYHPWSQRRRVAGASAGMVASLGPATPNGVVFLDQQRLRCVDPVSGETLWTRNDIPRECELFGDDEFVIAADAKEHALYVLKMVDGELVEKRGLPETPWLLTAGRNVVQLLDTRDSKQQPRKTLRIVDGVSGKTRFEAEYATGMRVATVEPNFVAVVDPGGKLQWIDALAGEVVVDESLPLDSPPNSLSVYHAGDWLYVCVNGGTRQLTSRPIGPDYPLVDGQVFAFDLRDGKMTWPGAARIAQRGIALAQPTDIPVLVFVDRLLRRDANGSASHPAIAVHRPRNRSDALSKRRFAGYLGRTVPHSGESRGGTDGRLGNDEPNGSPHVHRPAALAGTAGERLGGSPAQEPGRGLWGVGRRMGDLLQDALENPGKSGDGTEGDTGNAAPEFDDD